MKILGIDPGLRVSGYVVLSGESVEVSGVLPNNDLLSAVIPAYCEAGTFLAVEELGGQGRFVGLDELRTARWSGRFEERWIHEGGLRRVGLDSVRFVLRAAVKVSLLGRANGTDGQIRRALLDRWGGDEVALGPKKQKKRKGVEPIRGPLYGISSHAWQALAVAVVAREILERETAAGMLAPPSATGRPATAGTGAATSGRGTPGTPSRAIQGEIQGVRQ